MAKTVVTGEHEVIAAYEALSARVDNLEWFFQSEELQIYIYRLQGRHFRSEGSGAWEPVTERTRKEKERLGYGGQPTMVREGRFRASLTEAGADHSIWTTLPHSVAWGTDYFFAAAQHFGSDKAHLPPRSLLAPELESGDNEIPDIAARQLTEFARGLGFIVTDVLGFDRSFIAEGFAIAGENADI